VSASLGTQLASSQLSQAVRVLAKGFSELLHHFVQISGVRRGHSLGTQFADSIFQTTRGHQYRTSQAIGMSKTRTSGLFVRYSIQCRRDKARDKTGSGWVVRRRGSAPLQGAQPRPHKIAHAACPFGPRPPTDFIPKHSRESRFSAIFASRAEVTGTLSVGNGFRQGGKDGKQAIFGFHGQGSSDFRSGDAPCERRRGGSSPNHLQLRRRCRW